MGTTFFRWWILYRRPVNYINSRNPHKNKCCRMLTLPSFMQKSDEKRENVYKFRKIILPLWKWCVILPVTKQILILKCAQYATLYHCPSAVFCAWSGGSAEDSHLFGRTVIYILLWLSCVKFVNREVYSGSEECFGNLWAEERTGTGIQKDRGAGKLL